MRNLTFVFALALAAPTIGCSAPTDNTMNRMDDNGGDPNYPVGPYGYVEGSVVANYKFLGETPASGAYPGVVSPLLLGAFHDDSSMKLLLIEGSANWCVYCNEEAPTIEKLATDHPDGFRALTVLAEGHVRGVASTADDITDWVASHDLHSTVMGIDPEARLFQYADTSAFPLHILLDTTTMTIQWLCVGGYPQCDAETTVSAALGQ
jgi:thiol-disulfide isomerase/thioredoxin